MKVSVRVFSENIVYTNLSYSNGGRSVDGMRALAYTSDVYSDKFVVWSSVSYKNVSLEEADWGYRVSDMIDVAIYKHVDKTLLYDIGSMESAI